MACQAAGKPWQAYACLKCRRAAPARHGVRHFSVMSFLLF
ncbi:hypothetical protein ECP02994384_5207 [Escherichia coli P0299438.4]|nr:hypothetical protein ECP02994384_5207 [Escherichia coli P0299438.4]